MISDVSLWGRKCCMWGQLGSYIKYQVSMQNSWHWVSTYTSLSPYQLNTMPFHWRRRVGNESNISISLQLSHTCYLEYSTGQVQDWVNTSCSWLSMQEHQWNKRTHLLAAHFALLFIIIVHLHSLVPMIVITTTHLCMSKFHVIFSRSTDPWHHWTFNAL